MVALGRRVTLSIAVRDNAGQVAVNFSRIRPRLVLAMEQANDEAARFIQQFFEQEATRITKKGSFWPISSQSIGPERRRITVGKSRAHWIHPTKPHGILANMETGFFARGSVYHPGSKPVNVIKPLARRRIRTLRGIYRTHAARALGVGVRSVTAMPNAGSML